MWSKTQILPFPNYFYDDQFITDTTIASGLHIDYVENFCTEERRLNVMAPIQKQKLVEQLLRILMH